MHRIDNSTAVAALPAPLPVGTPGFFTRGNDPTGVAATRVDDNWLNTVQEEIANVVLAAGLQLSKVSNTQLYEAIQAIAYGANPDLSAYLPLSGGTLSNPGNLVVNGALDAAQNVSVGGELRLTGALGYISRPLPTHSLVLSAGGAVNLANITLAATNVQMPSDIVSIGGYLPAYAPGHIPGVVSCGHLEVHNWDLVLHYGKITRPGFTDINIEQTESGNLRSIRLVSDDVFLTGQGIIYSAFAPNRIALRWDTPLQALALWVDAPLDMGTGYNGIFQLNMVTANPINVAPTMTDALAAVRAVELYAYDDPDRATRRNIGFLPQQMRAAMPEAINSMQLPERDEPQLTVDLMPIAAYALRAIQQLADRVEALERRPAPLPA